MKLLLPLPPLLKVHTPVEVTSSGPSPFASYVCDGSVDTCNASWCPDCANGADESLETCGEDHDECVEVDCDAVWSACVESLVGTDYYEACSAEDCVGGPGGECDGAVVPGLTSECGDAQET